MPFNGMEQNHVADILFRGQQQFEKMDEEARKVNDSAKAADTFVKANPELLQQLGLTPEQWRAGGSRDRVNMLTGFMQAQGYQRAHQELQMQQQHQQLQGELLRQQIAKLTGQDTEDEAIGAALKNYANSAAGPGPGPAAPALAAGPAQPPPDVLAGLMNPDPASMAPPAPDLQAAIASNGSTAPGPDLSALRAQALPGTLAPAALSQAPNQSLALSPEIRAALNTPGIGGRGALRLADELAKLGMLDVKARGKAGIDWEDVKPRAFDVNGVAGAYGKSGQFQFLPNTSADAEPLVDPNTGEPVPGAYNVGGKVLRIPQPNASATRKMDVSAIVEAEKAMQGIDGEIAAYNSRLDRSKADKNVKPLPESRLAELLSRKARLERVLNPEEPSAPAAAPAPAAAGPVAQPRTPAEYQKLAPGTLYLNPADGKTYRKKK